MRPTKAAHEAAEKLAWDLRTATVVFGTRGWKPDEWFTTVQYNAETYEYDGASVATVDQLRADILKAAEKAAEPFNETVARLSTHKCDQTQCCRACKRHVNPHLGCMLR